MYFLKSDVVSFVRNWCSFFCRSVYIQKFWLKPLSSKNMRLHKCKKMLKKRKQFHAVSHPSTNQAQRCLTSVIGREPAW